MTAIVETTPATAVVMTPLKRKYDPLISGQQTPPTEMSYDVIPDIRHEPVTRPPTSDFPTLVLETTSTAPVLVLDKDAMPPLEPVSPIPMDIDKTLSPRPETPLPAVLDATKPATASVGSTPEPTLVPMTPERASMPVKDSDIPTTHGVIIPTEDPDATKVVNIISDDESETIPYDDVSDFGSDDGYDPSLWQTDPLIVDPSAVPDSAAPPRVLPPSQAGDTDDLTASLASLDSAVQSQTDRLASLPAPLLHTINSGWRYQQHAITSDTVEGPIFHPSVIP